MGKRTSGTDAKTGEARFPAGVALKPPVTLEDLTTDTEYDPEGAEEFLALIRSLRNEATRSVTL
jgi:hypothetical protein